MYRRPGARRSFRFRDLLRRRRVAPGSVSGRCDPIPNRPGCRSFAVLFCLPCASAVQGECTDATLPRMKRYALAAALLFAASGFAAPKKATVPMKPLTPAELHSLAHDYYEWQKKTYPVGASDQGYHAADDKLDDFSPAATARNTAHVRALLDRVRAADVAAWSKDDKIDWLLFRSQLEGADFPERVLKPEETDPQVYVGEASNAIFSLLKKDYAPGRTRALAATARLKAMPAMIE